MSDISLKASIDFRDAEAQVKTFVQNAQKSLASIKAAATAPGGSLAGGRNPVANQASAAVVQAERADRALQAARKKAYAQWWRDELEFRSRLETLQRKSANDVVKFEREAEERRRTARRGAIRQTFIDEKAANEAWTALEKREADKRKAARELADREEAQSLSRRRSGYTAWWRQALDDRARAKAAEFSLEREAAAAWAEIDAKARSKQKASRDLAEKEARESLSRQRSGYVSFWRHTLDQQDAANAAKTAQDTRQAALDKAHQEALLENRKRTLRAQAAADETARKQAEKEYDNQWRAALAHNRRLDQLAKKDATQSVSQARTQAVDTRSNIRVIGSAENNALGVSNRINRQLGEDPALQARLYAQLDSALGKYTNTVRQYGARSTEALRASVEWNRELQNIRGTIAEKGGLLRTLNNNTNSLRDSIGNLGTGFSSLNRLMLNTQVVLTGLTAAFGFREIVQSIMNFERFSNTLRTVSGNTENYTDNLRFLYSEADRIGFSVGEVGNAFARLSVAMQGAGFTNNDVQQSFTNLSEAARNFGLSSADTNGVIRALEQSMSKGKFMAEEVRLQLGDRLPIAMAALQAAVERVDGGFVDINKRFEEGSLDVQRYGLAFMEEIRRMSGGAEALARTSTSMQAAFGRLGTEFTRFTQALDEGGFGAAVASAVTQLVEFMRVARESGALEVLGQALLVVSNNLTTIAGAFAGLAAAVAGTKLVQAGAALVTLARNLNPIGLAITGVTTVAVGLGAAFANSASAAGDASRQISQALRVATTNSEAAATAINDASTRMSSGFEATSTSAESAFDRIYQSALRMGQNVEEAMRTALEATKNTIQAQVRSTEVALTSAQRNLERFINQSTNLSRIQGNLDSNVARVTSSGYGVPADFLEMAGRFNEAMERVRTGAAPIQEIAQELRALQGDAQSALAATAQSANAHTRAISTEFAAISNLIETLLRSFGRLDESTLNNLRTQIEGISAALREQNDQLRAAQGALDTGSAPRDSALPLPPPVVRPVEFTSARSNRQRTAENNLRRELTEAGAIGQNSGNTISRLGISPTVEQMRAFVEEAKRLGDTGAAEMLKRYNDTLNGTQDAAAGARNSVAEFMRDLELSAQAAEAATGAEKAHADALRRLRDASTNARGSVEARNREAEVERQVQDRLNRVRAASIRTMDREAEQTQRVAEAYAQSNEVGRAMEIRIQAETKALDTARVGTEEYRQAVEDLTAAYTREATSRANAAAGRTLATMREEMEVLRLEGQLISSNVNLREEELAVLRARQQALGASPEMLNQIEQVTRQTVRLRQENQQIQNSWDEMSRLGEQAFERIGSAITEAFAKGQITALNFKNIAKAVFSEVIQAALKMAVINPVLNTIFGGNRGTIGGVFSALGAGGGGGMFSAVSSVGASATGGGASIVDSSGNVIGQISNIASGRTAMNGLTGNMGSFFPGGSPFGTTGIMGSTGIGGFLNTPLVANTMADGTNAALAAMGGQFGPATPSAVFAAGGTPGLTLGQALGPAASIAGGAYGIYSGLQRGGAGGYTSAAGGLASVVGGGLSLAGGLGLIGPGLAALGPLGIGAGAILAIAGSLLPGQKPSGQGQLARTNLNTGSQSFEGLGGNRFSAANRDNSTSTVNNIVSLAQEIGDKLGGARIGGNVAVGTTNSTLYLEVHGQKGQYANNEDGAKKLAEAAAQMVLNEYRAQGTVQGDYRGIVAASNNLDELNANLQWYEEVYKGLNKVEDAGSKVAAATKAVVDKWNPLIDKAHSLGLSSDALVAAREREWQAAKKAVEEQERAREAEIAMQRASLDARKAAASGVFDYEATRLVGQTTRAKAWADELRTLEENLLALGDTTENVAQQVAKLKEVQSAEYWTAFAAALQDIDQSNQSRVLRAAGRTGEADWLDFERAAKKQIDDLRRALAELGAEASTAAAKIADTEKAIQAERDARWREANAQVYALDVSNVSRTLRAKGKNNEADIFDFETNAVREIENVRKSLTELGFSAAIVAKKVQETEAVIAAERVALQKRIADEIAEKQKRAAEEAARAWEQVLQAGRGIREYINAQRANNGAGGVSTAQALAEAQRQFSQDLTLARGGDMDALGRITSTADRVLQTAQAQYASSVDYQAIRNMVLQSLENLPATRSYDAMILEELRKLKNGINVTVDLEVIRVITEALNALPAKDAAKLVQTQIVMRTVEENLGRTLTSEERARLASAGNVLRVVEQAMGRDLTTAERASLINSGVALRSVEQAMGRNLTTAERDSLIAGGSVLRLVEQALGRNLSPTEREGLVVAATVQRTIEQVLGRKLTPAELAMLVEPGFIQRIVKQQIETTETVQISRSMDDKLSSILNAQLVIGRETLNAMTAIGTEANNHTRQIMSDMNNLWRNAAGVGWTGGLLVRSNWSEGRSAVGFAKGGVFDRPIMFPMAGGRTGLMGEAGPEAIMPLRRDANGVLGVRATFESDAMSLFGQANGDIISSISAAIQSIGALYPPETAYSIPSSSQYPNNTGNFDDSIFVLAEEISHLKKIVEQFREESNNNARTAQRTREKIEDNTAENVEATKKTASNKEPIGKRAKVA